MNEKAENFHSENLFYVFVNLNGVTQLPEYHIVPSKTVSKYIKKSHKQWLAKPGKQGQQHNDSSMRKYEVKSKKYLNKWDILQL